MTFFATCPKGLEALLARELGGLGVETLQESVAGCYFDCALALAYRVCMQSRVANRVVLVLLRREVDSAASLLEAASHCDWQQHFSATHSIAIDFNGSNDFIRNAKYGAQLVKDALNDHFRAQGQGRVQLDTTAPGVRLYARLFKRRFTLGVDLVGESLHRRGYRAAGGEAPLKENLAAALLLLCDWPAMAQAGASFVDPMCGSGTLLVEAALQAGSIAPGYLRNDWPLLRLHSADAALWRDCLEHAAIDLCKVSLPCNIFGSDASAGAVQVAQQNLDRAGLAAHVQLRTIALAKLPADSDCFAAGTGLLLTNPPYGQRLGERGELSQLYAALGNLLKQHCTGWQAAILTDNAELGWSTGLRSFRQHKVNNGNIACQLLRYRVAPANYLKSRTRQQEDEKGAAHTGAQGSAAQAATAAGTAIASGTASSAALSEGATMLANRLRKNRRRLKAWLAAAAVPSYRLYDADLPEYAVAIDCYAARTVKDSGPWGAAQQLASRAGQEVLQYFLVQEYAAPASVEPAIAQHRLAEAVAAVCAVFAVEPAHVVVKRRERQRGKQQY
ncbi:MAG: bifunctional 23S rRNA (guanine(2069)-N(7))-methyltransferase RlmK/23S rRNA (guanine(2445)-N(2))-methyltransferase RlmL, partial [Pseudomonadales bacterium]